MKHLTLLVINGHLKSQRRRETWWQRAMSLALPRPIGPTRKKPR